MFVTIANKLTAPTHIRLPSTGAITPIAGSGTLTVSDDDRRALLDDPNQFARFTPGGDLSMGDVTPTDSPARAFAATVDVTVSPQTVNLVPALATRSWRTRETVITVARASGSPTAAAVTLRSGGNIVEGYNIDSTGWGPGFNTPVHTFGYAAPTGDGLDISVDTASTGGTLAVTIEVRGEYI